MSSIKQTVRQFLATNFIVSDLDSVGDADSLLDRRILDSTGFIELISFLEETFGIRIADEEMIPENLDSLGAIESYVNRKQSSAAS
jgi:acyl carrier protein